MARALTHLVAPVYRLRCNEFLNWSCTRLLCEMDCAKWSGRCSSSAPVALQLSILMFPMLSIFNVVCVLCCPDLFSLARIFLYALCSIREWQFVMEAVFLTFSQRQSVTDPLRLVLTHRGQRRVEHQLLRPTECLPHEAQENLISQSGLPIRSNHPAVGIVRSLAWKFAIFLRLPGCTRVPWLKRGPCGLH